MMTHQWRGMTTDHDKKAASDLNYQILKRYTSTLYQMVKSKDVEIVEAEILLLNSVLIRIESKCHYNVDRLCPGRVHRNV